MRSRLMWFGIGFISVLITALAIVWFDRASVESKVLAKLIKKIQPSLPFEIQDYELGKNLDSLKLRLNYQGEEILIDGPIHWQWIRKNGIEIQYKPLVALDGASSFPIALTLHTERQWDKLDDLELDVPPTDFVWKRYGVESKGLSLKAVFDGDAATAEVQIASGAWTDPKRSDRAVNLAAFDLSLSIPQVKTPKTLTAKFSGKHAESLFGNFYLDLPLEPFPLDFKSTDGKSLDLRLGKDQLVLHADLDQPAPDFKQADIQFKAKPVNLAEFLPWATKNLGSLAPFMATLSDYQVKKGSLQASGNARYRVGKEKGEFELQKILAKGVGIHLRAPEKKLVLKDLEFDVNYTDTAREHVAHIRVGKLAYQHFLGSLKPMVLTWDQAGFQIPAVPLEVKDLPLTVGRVDATFKPKLNLLTSMKLKPVDATAFARGFCVQESKFPPISVTGDFTKIELSGADIDPTGKITASLFDGTIEMNDIGIFDLDTEVPETDIDFDWSGISMQKMNEWLKFGEVKGTLEGYAHDVVFQGALPTQYHFMINVAPLDRLHTSGRVEFSPEAMKNTVKLFSGSDIEQQIPGVAGWLMFGWPSHLLGGYDVYYAGLKLTSEDGHIVVETLDKAGLAGNEGKHFVLFGTRFKMPLRNDTYPLIVDAASMSNFVHQLLTQFQAIKQKKEGTTYEEDTEIPCDPPEL